MLENETLRQHYFFLFNKMESKVVYVYAHTHVCL